MRLYLRPPNSSSAAALPGGMWEEPGWSGFALPRLQERYTGRRLGLLEASLMLGALRAAWHIPL